MKGPVGRHLALNHLSNIPSRLRPCAGGCLSLERGSTASSWQQRPSTPRLLPRSGMSEPNSQVNDTKSVINDPPYTPGAQPERHPHTDSCWLSRRFDADKPCDGWPDRGIGIG